MFGTKIFMATILNSVRIPKQLTTGTETLNTPVKPSANAPPTPTVKLSRNSIMS